MPCQSLTTIAVVLFLASTFVSSTEQRWESTTIATPTITIQPTDTLILLKDTTVNVQIVINPHTSGVTMSGLRIEVDNCNFGANRIFLAPHETLELVDATIIIKNSNLRQIFFAYAGHELAAKLVLVNSKVEILNNNGLTQIYFGHAWSNSGGWARSEINAIDTTFTITGNTVDNIYIAGPAAGYTPVVTFHSSGGGIYITENTMSGDITMAQTNSASGFAGICVIRTSNSEIYVARNSLRESHLLQGSFGSGQFSMTGEPGGRSRLVYEGNTLTGAFTFGYADSSNHNMTLYNTRLSVVGNVIPGMFRMGHTSSTTSTTTFLFTGCQIRVHGNTFSTTWHWHYVRTGASSTMLVRNTNTSIRGNSFTGTMSISFSSKTGANGVTKFYDSPLEIVGNSYGSFLMFGYSFSTGTSRLEFHRSPVNINSNVNPTHIIVAYVSSSSTQATVEFHDSSPLTIRGNRVQTDFWIGYVQHAGSFSTVTFLDGSDFTLEDNYAPNNMYIAYANAGTATFTLGVDCGMYITDNTLVSGNLGVAFADVTTSNSQFINVLGGSGQIVLENNKVAQRLAVAWANTGIVTFQVSIPIIIRGNSVQSDLLFGFTDAPAVGVLTMQAVSSSGSTPSLTIEENTVLQNIGCFSTSGLGNLIVAPTTTTPLSIIQNHVYGEIRFVFSLSSASAITFAAQAAPIKIQYNTAAQGLHMFVKQATEVSLTLGGTPTSNTALDIRGNRVAKAFYLGKGNDPKNWNYEVTVYGNNFSKVDSTNGVDMDFWRISHAVIDRNWFHSSGTVRIQAISLRPWVTNSRYIGCNWYAAEENAVYENSNHNFTSSNSDCRISATETKVATVTVVQEATPSQHNGMTLSIPVPPTPPPSPSPRTVSPVPTNGSPVQVSSPATGASFSTSSFSSPSVHGTSSPAATLLQPHSSSSVSGSSSSLSDMNDDGDGGLVGRNAASQIVGGATAGACTALWCVLTVLVGFGVLLHLVAFAIYFLCIRSAERDEGNQQSDPKKGQEKGSNHSATTDEKVSSSSIVSSGEAEEDGEGAAYKQKEVEDLEDEIDDL